MGERGKMGGIFEPWLSESADVGSTDMGGASTKCCCFVFVLITNYGNCPPAPLRYTASNTCWKPIRLPGHLTVLLEMCGWVATLSTLDMDLLCPPPIL